MYANTSGERYSMLFDDFYQLHINVYSTRKVIVGRWHFAVAELCAIESKWKKQ